MKNILKMALVAGSIGLISSGAYADQLDNLIKERDSIRAQLIEQSKKMQSIIKKSMQVDEAISKKCVEESKQNNSRKVEKMSVECLKLVKKNIEVSRKLAPKMKPFGEKLEMLAKKFDNVRLQLIDELLKQKDTQ